MLRGDLINQFFKKHVFSRKHLFIGIGSHLRSDDQAGLVLCDKLIEKGMDCLKCEAGLEMCIHEVYSRRPEVLVIFDAVIYPGCSPGEVVIADEKAIKKETSIVTTHSISFETIMQFLRSTGGVEEIYVVGICPERIDLGLEISEKVAHSIEKLAGIITSQCYM
ncbi:MAG: hydrogenase maturation protease [Desulfurococcaceae archaeon]